MTLLIDANILLDVLMDRQPFTKSSSLVWKLCETGLVRGYVSVLSFADIVYIMRKSLSPDKTESLLRSLAQIFLFADLRFKDLQKAAGMRWGDYEDAIQVTAAKAVAADYIVTRNLKDYAQSPVPAILPEQLCAMF